ncbi:MAG: hypothetical protein FWD71_09440 [Oscillospiraceae bacterium]|nr:hypothetical protein [Oscillospiraceae bacterium]
MIFGFSILKHISDDLALRIIDTIKGTVTDTSVNNAIRNFSINHFTNSYSIWLTVNAGVLVGGKETVDVEFTNEPDFSALDERFTECLAEIVGKDSAEKIPRLREWGLWTMRYGMDIRLEHIDETMRVFARTDMPVQHLNPQNAIDIVNGVPAYMFRETGKKDGKLEIYPKSDLIKLGYLDYKGITEHLVEKNKDTVRLVMNHSRRHMGYAKRFLTKFEMDVWRLESFLNPLVVTNTFRKAYLDTIGNGDFYKYETALEIIENEVSNFQNRKILIDLLNNISERGSVAKARECAADKTKFRKELKLLRDAGINGALLEPDAKIGRIQNPFDEICKKCRIYSP